MTRYRQPDGLPLSDVPEEWDGAKVIYIERPLAPKDDKLTHILQVLTLGAVMGMAGFVWRYTVTNESRMTAAETEIKNIKERLLTFPRSP